MQGRDQVLLGQLDGLRRLGEAQVDDLDLVAAVAVEADRGAHEGGDPVEFLLGRGW